MRTPIYVRRGNKVDLPVLNAGEPGFAVDTKEVFIGQSSGGNLQFAMKDSKTAQVVSGGYKVQSGTYSSPSTAMTANTYYSFTVTFPTPFAVAPGVIPSIISGTPATTYFVLSASSTVNNFTLTIVAGATGTYALNVFWEAIGS